MHQANPDSLKNCLCLRVFRLSFVFEDFCNWLLVKSHQEKIVILKHLIQKRNNETKVGVEPTALRS